MCSRTVGEGEQVKNLFWAAVLIAVVPELVFLAADPAGVGTDVGTAAGLVGVGVTVAMVAVLGRRS
jgi:hypothetical protein